MVGWSCAGVEGVHVCKEGMLSGSDCGEELEEEEEEGVCPLAARIGGAPPVVVDEPVWTVSEVDIAISKQAECEKSILFYGYPYYYFVLLFLHFFSAVRSDVAFRCVGKRIPLRKK